MTDVDVVVVGGCIIDLMSYAPRFPKPGETLEGTDFEKGFGGKGANQCIMAHRLNASATMIAKLGDDDFGKEYLNYFKKETISTDHITFAKGFSTSAASICVTSEGLNNIVYVPGAIMQLMPCDVRDAERLIASSKIILCTFEARPDTLHEALTLARKHRVKTVVNAAPAPTTEHEHFYSLVDIICLNEVEAEQATGITVKNLKDAELAMENLLQKKCSTIILTLGSQGAIIRDSSNGEISHVPARRVNAIDSTGAGDAFMGSLVFYLSNIPELTLAEMVRRSCEIATESVLKRGTQSSFPYRRELSRSLFTSS